MTKGGFWDKTWFKKCKIFFTYIFIAQLFHCTGNFVNCFHTASTGEIIAPFIVFSGRKDLLCASSAFHTISNQEGRRVLDNLPRFPDYNLCTLAHFCLFPGTLLSIWFEYMTCSSVVENTKRSRLLRMLGHVLGSVSYNEACIPCSCMDLRRMVTCS